MKTFDVQMVSPHLLRPYYRNNKKHDKTQITLLARVLRKHGFDQPIVVDKDMVIIKGHGRWMAGMEAKFPEVPIVVRDDLEEWQVQASRIADNQSFALSTIDEDQARSEVLDFVKNGGVGAEFYFDFLRPPGAKPTPHAVGASVMDLPPVSGKIVTCPKCSHVQMEV